MNTSHTKEHCIAILSRLGFKLVNGAYTRNGIRGIETAELRRCADGSWVFDTYSA